MAKRGMGRGLDAILSVAQPDGQETLRRIPIDLIEPNPDQPRRQFDEATLQALADSLQDRGVLQPVLVRPKAGGRYELIAGERRWRAARIAELEEIPAIVRHNDDARTLEIALIENMARENLNPVEEARAVAALVEELGLTREEVGRRVGRGRVSVSNLLRLLDLPDEALDMLEQRTLTEGHGRALLLADDHLDRKRLAKAAAAEGWSVRILEARAREANGKVEQTPRSPAVKGREAPHPDEEAAAVEIAEILERGLRAPVTVRLDKQGRFRAEMLLGSPEEAAELVQRISAGLRP